MIKTADSLSITRRDLFRTAGMLTGGALIARFSPTLFAEGALLGQATQTAPAALDPVAAAAARRQAMGVIPIQQSKLGEKIVLLSGPGGNVIVLQGPDGKVIVDCFVTTAWANLKTALAALDASPVKLLIDTHWHFDHADNNANLHATGAAILAHENTKKRLTEPHDALGMHFDPAPAAGLPTETFKDTHTLHLNGEDLALEHVVPAHTDGDIFVHYAKANVLHMGDVFFNGFYPFIDASTGGNINGMVAGADRALKLADARTKIVPGHGPLGDKAALTVYRDVLATTRDAVKKLKTAGKSLTEVQAAKPTAAFDGVWGKGMLNADAFVALVYNTL
jgi:cyclase